MKTISEYQPLLFSTLERRAVQRDLRRERALRTARCAVPLLYAVAAIKITADTALVPWDLGFWIILAPMIAASEYALNRWRKA